MNPSAFNSQRRMVPRWRSLAATLKSQELGLPSAGKSKTLDVAATAPDLLTRLERWRLSPSLVSAAELVETCIVEGRENEAIDAALRLVSIDQDAAPLIRTQAAKLLARTGHTDRLPNDISLQPSVSRPPRYLTRLHPHDPLAWIELALAQTIGGAPFAAERSMRVALTLAPDNRHVLRSAARLYLHLGDPAHALNVVSRSSATRSDPWLMASEISIASVAEKSSRFLKAGVVMLDGINHNPRQITELASAVATEEMISGNRKKSRRAFTQSMIDPTGSSLAQGEWATARLGMTEVIAESQLAATFENAEAMAFHWARLRQFDRVRGACESWCENDPFSIRPFEFGSAAAGYVEDFETVLDFARRGLKLKPKSATLLNALAFASASLDRVGDAAAALSKLKTADNDRRTIHISNANYGLLAFRIGDEAEGRRHYSAAIEGFRRDNNFESAARAKIYLAREAIRANLTDWPDLLKQAQDAMVNYKDSEGMASLRLVEQKAKERAADQQSTPPMEPLLPPVTANLTIKTSFTLNARDSANATLPKSKGPQ
jgi:tetratricopeptide (TPR) repeat protein